ncbi:MAG: hypothetical protein NXH97_13530 [Rhodobacteraceae bacterium]|nr:hypothetical protein [Paracoccaceae bacterium]
MNERTQTLFPATRPEGLMTVIVNYSEGEHDLTFESGPDGALVIEMEGARLTFQSGGVWVDIAVPEPAV